MPAESLSPPSLENVLKVDSLRETGYCSHFAEYEIVEIIRPQKSSAGEDKAELIFTKIITQGSISADFSPASSDLGKDRVIKEAFKLLLKQQASLYPFTDILYLRSSQEKAEDKTDSVREHNLKLFREVLDKFELTSK